MILICRGVEPLELVAIRSAKLGSLRALGRAPESKDIKGYEAVAEVLWEAQHGKCCYCEVAIPCPYNDVEHFRPKAKAIRLPGCTKEHGYWWLAYTWNNLLFACPSCNRSSKRCEFPLAVGCSSLLEGEDAPGLEVSLLVDPSVVNPMGVIFFKEVSNSIKPHIKRWHASPFGGHVLAERSIKVFGLNEQDRVEMRQKFFDRCLVRRIDMLRTAIENKNHARVVGEVDEFRALFLAMQPHASFAFSVFADRFSDVDFNAWGINPIDRFSVGV